jgi:hypothetical protein
MLSWFRSKVEPVHLLSILALGVVAGLAFTGSISGESTVSFISGAILGAGSIAARSSHV